MPSAKRSAPGDESTSASRSTKRYKPASTSSSKENAFEYNDSISSPPKPQLVPPNSVLNTTQENAPVTLKIRIPSTRNAKATTTLSAPPSHKPSATSSKSAGTYNMDPDSRRTDLSLDPSVQFIHSTPYVVYCRPCAQTVTLERRGKGYYAQNFATRHALRAAHKNAVRTWIAKGGDKVKAEDESVQWKCVYWKEDYGKENSVVNDRVVGLDEGLAAEALLELKAGEPREGCGGEKAVVDRSGENDLIEYVKCLQTERRDAATRKKRRGATTQTRK